MSKIAFDIETIGENYDELDETSKHMLTRWIKAESFDTAAYEKEMETIRDGLGFSPLTGQIVAIGVLDIDTEQGAVYYDAPGQTNEEKEVDGVKLKQMGEKEMLEKFWDIAKRCQECISFNGRAFDVPFMMVRSAIHKIRPPVNLMPPRFSSNANHIDLMDQLSFYGTVRKKGNLHMWCRAFGIKSPKADGVSGDDVGKLFKEKEFLKIAEYNVGDLKATRELYQYWNDYMRF